MAREGPALEAWQVGISFPRHMTLEQAVAVIRPALMVESGSFEIVDGPHEEKAKTAYVILLQVDSSLMEGKTSGSQGPVAAEAALRHG